MNRDEGVEKNRTWNGLFTFTIPRAVHMTSTCFKIRAVCDHQHDHFCNHLFLAPVKLRIKVHVGLYKVSKF